MAGPSMVDEGSLQLRVVAGLLASAARFVPVPFLDDLLRQKALQLMVSRTLRAHERTFGSNKVAPLYSDDAGFLHGCLLWLVLCPIKLILFPVRKVVAFVMAGRRLASDLTESVLLGRVLDRHLAAGGFAPAAELKAEAGRVRRAFDNAVRGTDMAVLRSILRRTLKGSVAGLRVAAMHALRALHKEPEGADPTSSLSAAERETVDRGARKITSALRTPEAIAFLEAFDARFDENLRILSSR